MKTAVIAFTQKGAETAKMLAEKIGADGYTKYAARGMKQFDAVSEIIGDIFKNYNALIFVGACGIAVRAIAPYIKDKSKDPAVVVADERGGFAIPILSGHIGGANDLAKKIAALTNGTAVITTATDINNKFSVDTFAVKNNLHIGDTKLIKEISSRVLRGEKIGLYTDYELKNVPDCFNNGAKAGICISDSDKKPFDITLNLKPKNIILGIGCKKNCENVEKSVLEFLKTNRVSLFSLFAVATIDIKKDEPGILNFCGKYDLPLLTFTARELANVEGNFTSSDFVKKTVGVDNVCERAVCAAGARLCAPKTPLGGTALALGKLKTEIDFLKGI
ncbi:MAG: cobalt-precorrin 5A hydrolase [Firmicutes bacterium]|nr:cobalt-precorrin 5A hydrolase [Bacillota bacterium]